MDVFDEELLAWLSLGLGCGLLIFLSISLYFLHRSDYRMWRLVVLVHRWGRSANDQIKQNVQSFKARHTNPSTSAAPVTVAPMAHAHGARVAQSSINSNEPTLTYDGVPVDRDGFDAQGHWHDLSIPSVRTRRRWAPFFLCLLAITIALPICIVVAWGICVWVLASRETIAIAAVLMGICGISLYYAVMYWKTGGWRMTRHIAYLFLFSLACYFGLAFVLSFLSSSVSFFALSAHFLALNYVILTEMLSRAERVRQIPAHTILKAGEIVLGKDHKPIDKDDENDNNAHTANQPGSPPANTATPQPPAHHGLQHLYMSKEERHERQRRAEIEFFQQYEQEDPGRTSSTMIRVDAQGRTFGRFGQSQNTGTVSASASTSAAMNQQQQQPVGSQPADEIVYVDSDEDLDVSEDDDDDDDDTDDDDDDGGANRHKGTGGLIGSILPDATLVDIVSTRIQAGFQDILRSLATEKHHSQESAEAIVQIKLYMTSLAVLLAYVLMIYFWADAPVSSADVSTDDTTSSSTVSSSARYMGFVVSGILFVWDLLIYFYVRYCGHPVDDRTKILVLAGSRVALTAFGFDGWFLGVCCLYTAAGFYFCYRIVDRRLPFQGFQLNFGKKRCQLFSQYCATDTNPDRDDGSRSTDSSGGSTFIGTLGRSGSRGGIHVGEVVFLLLTMAFFMCLTITYQTNKDASSSQLPIDAAFKALDGDPSNISDYAAWRQWEIGLAVWYSVMLWLLALVTTRSFMIHSWKIKPRSLCWSLVTQLAFSLGGALGFIRTGSVILLVMMVCGPLFVLSLLGTYSHCIAVDWRVFTSSRHRSPPGSPFWLAFLRCGLPKDDIRMLVDLSLVCTSMVAMGLAITFGMHGSSIGWSVTFVLFLLITSLTPLIKYLKTLHLARIDAFMLSLWFADHVTFFSILQWYHGSSLSDRELFALWGCALGYPTLLANILAYHLWKESDEHRITKNIAMILGFSACLLILFVLVSFFTLGWVVGCIILGALVMCVVATLVMMHWVHGHYVLSPVMRYTIGIAIALMMAGGIVAGVLLPDDDAGFGAFSASWFLLILYVALMAYGEQQRLIGDHHSSSSGKNRTVSFRYSSYIFPVYFFDRHNTAQPIRRCNATIGMYFICFILCFVWCAAAMATERTNVGLGISALGIITLYTFARNKSVEANKHIMKVIDFVTEDVVKKSREASRESQLGGLTVLFDVADHEERIFGLGRWSRALPTMMQRNLNPIKALKRKQKELKRKLGLLHHHCFCAPLNTDLQQLDEHMLLLERLHEWSAIVSSIHFALDAHFYFLLLSHAQSRVAVEEGRMRQFVQWVRANKVDPATQHPVELDPYITNYDLYDAPWRLSAAKILKVRNWKDEWIQSIHDAAAKNEKNRKIEQEAEARRTKKLKERMKKMEKRKKEREAAAKALEAQRARDGIIIPPTPSPVVPPTPSPGLGPTPSSASSLNLDQLISDAKDPETKEFWEIVAEHQRTGKQWEDPDFPADNSSLYLEGERNPMKGTALNMTRIDCWLRPKALLQLIAKEHPPEPGEPPISFEPKLFVDGFSLSDIVQGNLGTCYFLSAMGCLGLREISSTPHQPLLTKLFLLESPSAQYNSCGCFLVKFYRGGREVRVLIDDRLPVHQGSFAFSHCRDPSEMWVALLEKAYAKLFTCYEAIEAGIISQALCDLSNGASEQIALKDAHGTLQVQPDAMWVQLMDAATSGYLIGAGSNSGSDTTMVQGIAQGHAYVVVRVFTDAKQTERLVQLQNPHGHGEWEGDWSDTSDKWTQWWQATLDHDPSKLKDDGKFWMSFEDFLNAYANIYICRLLPYRHSLQSEWKGKTAAGPYKPALNPTFVVTAKRRMKVWIELEQENQRGKRHEDDDDGEDDNNDDDGGYAFIQFYVFENGGKRVQKITRDGIKACANKGKLRNDRQISEEFLLESPGTPYSIVCITKQVGFETGLTLSVFAAEEGVTLKELPPEV